MQGGGPTTGPPVVDILRSGLSQDDRKKRGPTVVQHALKWIQCWQGNDLKRECIPRRIKRGMIHRVHIAVWLIYLNFGDENSCLWCNAVLTKNIECLVSIAIVQAHILEATAICSQGFKEVHIFDRTASKRWKVIFYCLMVGACFLIFPKTDHSPKTGLSTEEEFLW